MAESNPHNESDSNADQAPRPDRTQNSSFYSVLLEFCLCKIPNHTAALLINTNSNHTSVLRFKDLAHHTASALGACFEEVFTFGEDFQPWQESELTECFLLQYPTFEEFCVCVHLFTVFTCWSK